MSRFADYLIDEFEDTDTSATLYEKLAEQGPSALVEALAAIAEDPAVSHQFVVNGFDLIGGGNKTQVLPQKHTFFTTFQYSSIITIGRTLIY